MKALGSTQSGDRMHRGSAHLVRRLIRALDRPKHVRGRVSDAGRTAGREQPQVLLVCSPGGHLQQLLALAPAWDRLDHAWVTLPGSDVEDLLADEHPLLAYGPTNRSLRNLIRNLPFAWRTIRRLDPDVILSTGAGVAVPFFLVGKLLHRRLVYVESFTRTQSLSLSGRLVYPLADEFFVQWPQAANGRRMRYAGRVL
jgi:beta-1,4-N-acetylglucosaminyltransferase